MLDPQKILDTFLANLPTIIFVFGALGLWRALAAIGRKLFGDVEKAAAKTETKLDDVVVAAVKPNVEHLLDLIERGDTKAVQTKAGEVRALLKKKA
jgi:hypothetical protein